MKTGSLKKILVPNILYLFILWACLKIGTAYRLAAGADFAHKLIGMAQTINTASADPAPGLAPFDWLVGIVGAATIRLFVYCKAKNAKSTGGMWSMASPGVSQSVINNAAGLIQGSTDITPDMLATLETTLEGMDIGPLLGLFMQSLVVGLTMKILGIVIFVTAYGRMLEIYMLTSLAPIPVATLSNRELGSTGQNYLKSLLAVGFQGLLTLVCVAIYAVLIQGIAASGDPIGAIWGTVGYTVLLTFMLFKTGGIAKSIFGAH